MPKLTSGLPINFQQWAKENEHLLQPPVNNFCIQRGGFTVMAVGGPNARTDYHINPTEEWFYQLRGDLLLKLDVDGEFQDLWIKEGDVFLLPANIPHSPNRFADTVGLVIERDRPAGELDRLRWYCEQCKCVLYEEGFYCVDLGQQLKPVIEKYYAHQELRTCARCHHINSIPESYLDHNNEEKN